MLNPDIVYVIPNAIVADSFQPDQKKSRYSGGPCTSYHHHHHHHLYMIHDETAIRYSIDHQAESWFWATHGSQPI